MSPAAIEVQGLVHRYGAVTALDGVDLRVEGPGLHGFLGVNGAGKSTAMRILNGFVRPTAGRVEIRGEPVSVDDPHNRRDVGYLPQTPAFPEWMTGREALCFAAELAGASRSEGRRQAEELLEQLELSSAADRRVRGYSGGMRQRLGLAQAVVGRPEILLLDEPVSALDPIGRVRVLELLGKLGERATVLLSSHILADVERICDRVTVIHAGKVVADETTESLRARWLRPWFDLELTPPVDALREELARADFVEGLSVLEERTEAGRTVLRVRVRDVERASHELPRRVVAHNVGLHGMQRVSPTLEEAFLHLVCPEEERS